MTLLNKSIKKAIAIKSISEQFDAPEQAVHIKVPSDNAPFQAKLDIAEVVVVEVKYKATDYKEHYIVDPDLAKQLDRKHYRIKMLHVIKTESGALKCILLPAKTKNSWHVSNLELLTQAQLSPVIAKRDSIAKVYVSHLATDITPIVITDTDVEQAYSNAFGQYEIADLNHPALAGKLKNNAVVDVVDEPEIELLDDTVTAEAHMPEPGSLEELQAAIQPINVVKNELEDEFESELDELEVDEIFIDEINIDEDAV